MIDTEEKTETWTIRYSIQTKNGKTEIYADHSEEKNGNLYLFNKERVVAVFKEWVWFECSEVTSLNSSVLNRIKF
jgi:hypothetical protein